MSGIRIEGSLSGNIAEVDVNKSLQATGPSDPTKAGVAIMYLENDNGANNGGVVYRNSPLCTDDRRMSVGLDTPLFDYTFNALAQDTGVWKHAFTTMTVTQSGGTALFNANLTGTITTGASLQTWRHFRLIGNAGLSADIIGSITGSAQANQVIEFGLFIATTTTAPADGVYFRYTNAGLVAVMNYNGTETTSGVLIASLTPNQNYSFQINITERQVEYWVSGSMYSELTTPAGQAQAFLTDALPLCVQFRNSGTVSGTQMQFKLGDVHVDQRDMQLAMSYPTQMAAMGNHHQGLSGGTMGSLALYTNNLAPGAGATPSNTSAALGTGLGGQFTAQPTLTANTDGIICSYQVPAGSVNQTPRTLLVYGIYVQGVVSAVLTGGPVIYQYSLAFGHTAVSMATTESASFANGTTKAPRREAIGIEVFAATAAAGTVGSSSGQFARFTAPIAVNPGEFIAVVAKNIGTVTSVGTITLLVQYDYTWI